MQVSVVGRWNTLDTTELDDKIAIVQDPSLLIATATLVNSNATIGCVVRLAAAVILESTPFSSSSLLTFNVSWNSDRSSPVYGRHSRSRSRDRSHRERSWSGGRAGSYERSRRKTGSSAHTPTKGSKLRERSRSTSPLKSTKTTTIEETQQEQLTKSRSGNGGYLPQRTPSKETTMLPAIGAGAGGD